MFAAGGLLGFAAMSKSSKSSKSKVKDKKKKGDAKVSEEASKSAEGPSDEAVGLGIISSADGGQADGPVEDVVIVPVTAALDDVKEDNEATPDASTSTSEGVSASAGEATVEAAITSDGVNTNPGNLAEAQPANQEPDAAQGTGNEQSGAPDDSQPEPNATTMLEAAFVPEDQADHTENADVTEPDSTGGAEKAPEETLQVPETLEIVEPASVDQEASSTAQHETIVEAANSADVETEQPASADAVGSFPASLVETQVADEVEVLDNVSRQDSGFAESVEDTSQDQTAAEELVKEDMSQGVAHAEEAADAVIEPISTMIAATEEQSEKTTDAACVEGLAADDIVSAVESDIATQQDEQVQIDAEGKQRSDSEPDAEVEATPSNDTEAPAIVQVDDTADMIVMLDANQSEEPTSDLPSPDIGKTPTDAKDEGVSTVAVLQQTQEGPLHENKELETEDTVTASGVSNPANTDVELTSPDDTASADVELTSPDATTQVVSEATSTEETPLTKTLVLNVLSDPVTGTTTGSDTTADAEHVSDVVVVAQETTQHAEPVALPEKDELCEEPDNNAEGTPELPETNEMCKEPDDTTGGEPELPETEPALNNSEQNNTAEEKVDTSQPDAVIESTGPIVEPESLYENTQEIPDVPAAIPAAPVEVQIAPDAPSIEVAQIAEPVAEIISEQHEEQVIVSDGPLVNSHAMVEPTAEPEPIVEQKPAEDPTPVTEQEPEITTSEPVTTDTPHADEPEPFVTEIVEPADATAAPRSATPDATPAEPLVTEVVVPAMAAATIVESPPSPTQSRASRRHRSERSDRPRSSKKKTEEPSLREKDSTRYEGRAERSTRDRRNAEEGADRRRRRDARKAEEMRGVAEDERRSAEEAEHRRIRREARHAAKEPRSGRNREGGQRRSRGYGSTRR
ncbi:hypothetical protein AMS68_006392 [Peltaster fructicola]|uniref:Uncharacterized protein n=1 Tax=Peltaster fructicola TaxID=286661 RepID=A0A6H0Y1S9_9PEZI|nr:hypothetical protein AMS68_006392 [Peltaster fructicola]